MVSLRISVNIPVYNREDLLQETLQSFENQIYEDFEVVVVDDGSFKSLREVVSKFPHARYIRQRHKGISAAFNLALENSTGDFIIPFGSDDLAIDEYALQKVSDYQQETNADVVYTNYEEFDHKYKNTVGVSKVQEVTEYKELLKNQCIPHGGSLWRKSKMPYYDESLESAVDWELMLTAWERGLTFKLLEDCLWTFRTGDLTREFKTERQIINCREVLRRRGIDYDKRYD
jgi:glycosyltransferase involved in cell wall biosynthesis